MSWNQPILSTGSPCGMILQQDLRVSDSASRVLTGHHGEVDASRFRVRQIFFISLILPLFDIMRSAVSNGTATERS
jgi:hypothetical protein